MNLAVLSGGTGPHVQDLLRAAAVLGVPLTALNFRTITSQTLAPYDGCLIRTMPAGSLEQIVFRMDLLHEAEACGKLLINPPRAVEACVNKFLTTERLNRAKIHTPRTFTVQTTSAAWEVFEALGEDVIVKPLFGAEGRGMLRVQQRDLAWRIFHAIEAIGGVLYLQERVPCLGWDFRVLVLNGRVLGAMKRQRQNDWRTNIAQGGIAEPCDLPEQAAAMAIRAAKAVGALFAGVDLMPCDASPTGFTCIEVNGVPGWATFQAVTGIDVAVALMKQLMILIQNTDATAKQQPSIDQSTEIVNFSFASRETDCDDHS